MKHTLGISAFYHDATAAIVSDGRVLATAAEERFTLQKHDQSFPKFSVEFCLKRAGLTAQELDRIVFYEEPHNKFTRVFSSSLSGYPSTRGAFVKAMKAWISSKLWIKNEISKRLDIDPRKVDFIPHHLSHASQAFTGSPYQEAAILVIDAVGEWSSTSLFHGSFDGPLSIRCLETLSYPHSLGLAYAAFTAFLGFKVNDGECSTMALSAFGRPSYADKIRQVIQVQSDGTYRIEPSYFLFERFTKLPFSQKFIAAFGRPRHFMEPLPFDSLREPGAGARELSPGLSDDQQRWADIAASLQLVLEETIFALCRRLHSLTGSKRLCLAGGVALNCVANGKLLEQTPFEEFFISPDPGDGGAAVGAALYGDYEQSGRRKSDFLLTPYLGQSYDESAELQMLENLKPRYWGRHRERQAQKFPDTMKLDYGIRPDFDSVVAETTEDLRNGKIVGWFQGRFENGPRALGNRSILIDPSNIAAARRLSTTTKIRASYRPYALSVSEDDAAKVFDGPLGGYPERWMQLTRGVRPSASRSVAATLHTDGTTRPQICHRDDNPKFHQLLRTYGQASPAGLAGLLNTSFNLSGLPLVSTPAEALLMFARTDIDTLVIGNLIVRKKS